MEDALRKSIFLPRVVTLLVIFFGIIFVASSFVGVLTGKDVIYVFVNIFIGAFGSLYRFCEVLVMSVPVGLAAIGVAIAFKAGFWNIGVEGQMLMGIIFALWGGTIFETSPALHVPLVLLLGFGGGCLWGLLPTVLKLKWGINEILTTMMMNFIADWISVYLILYTWDDPMIEAPQTFSVFSSATLPKIMMGTRLNAGFLIFITILILVCILYARHLFFFKVRVVGGSPRAAQYAGINSKKVILMSMVIGAGLAGLGGGLHLIGVERIMRMEMIKGYGFLAIAAALLGALHPLGVFLASLFICSVWNGSLYTVLLVGVRLHSAFIFSGLIVICVLLIHFAERRLLRWFGRYYSVRQQ